MSNLKLNITEILNESISLPIEKINQLLKVSLPLFISAFAVDYLDLFIPDGFELLSIGLMIIAVPCSILSLIFCIIRSHQIFLGHFDEHNFNPFTFTGYEVNFVIWTIVLMIFGLLIASPLHLFINPFIIEKIPFFNENNLLTFLLNTTLTLPSTYVISRWCLVIPATATGKTNTSIFKAWKLSKNNGIQVAILIGIIPILINFIFTILPENDSITFSILSDLIWLVFGVIEICILSLCYKYLNEINPIESAHDNLENM